MSKRGQVDLATDERVDSPQPVRRSSRISSGQNATTATSSPAPKAIRSRRSSANSIAEKATVETNNITSDTRRTRRASTDEDPKPAPIRGRRSSVSKVIEEEKTSTPNSPSRRNTRLSSSSPSLDVPARRTRRSSQDSETVEIPARRSTRRSSTGLQETAIEEVTEKAKPITRRRRSSSIDEQEEDAKVETRPKTKRLFNDDKILEPIEEQEQEVKEKDTVEEKQEVIHTLEVIEELADDESERILDSLNEVLGEDSSHEKSGEESVKLNTEDKTKTETNHKEETIQEQAASVDEKEKTEKDELPEGKSEKFLPENSLPEKSEGDKDKLTVEGEKPIEPPKEIDSQSSANNAQAVPQGSEAEKLKNGSAENSNMINSPKLVKSPVVQMRKYTEVEEVSLKEDNEIGHEKTENKTAIFASPGSDKENSSMNIPKKRRSVKLIEEISNKETEKSIFAAKKTPRNSLCEPMEVDQDEDDLFGNEASTNINPKEITMNGNHTEVIEEREPELVVQNVSLHIPEISENVFNKSGTIKNTSLTMEGSFSELNSSPDKESASVEKSKSPMKPRVSTTMNEIKTTTINIIEQMEDDDCASETSIKLVDTDEEEAAKIAADEQNKSLITETTQIPKGDVTVSLDESLLDKSFDSDNNQSTTTEKIPTENPSNEEGNNVTLVESEDEIIEVVDSNDATFDLTKAVSTNEDSQEQLSTSRKSINARETPSIEEKDENKVESKEVKESEDSILQEDGRKQNVPDEIVTVTNEESGVIEIMSTSPKSEDLQKSFEKNEEIEKSSLDNGELEKSVLESNDSKTNISMVKMDVSANELKETINVSQDIKLENNLEKNSPLRKSINKSIDSNDSEKSFKETCLKSVDQEPEKSKSVASPIILKSIKVIKQGGDEIQEIDCSKSSTEKSKTRHSLPKNTKSDKEEKEMEELRSENTKSRHSLPNRIRHERENISRLSLVKPAPISSSTESMNEEDEEILRSLDTEVNKSSVNEVHLISSSDDENNTLEIADGSVVKKIEDGGNKEKSENPNEDVKDSESVRRKSKRINPYSEAVKRKSVESVATAKRVCSEEADQEKVTEGRKSSKEKNRHSKKQIEILTKSGIDIEDEESSDEIERNEFIDDMAEEGEETSCEEESDENEIKDEGESVLSSGSEEESSEDDYDPNDSFIDDEEQELMSGEEEFLGLVGKKKKYKKIIAPSTSDSDEVFEPEEMSSKISKVPIHEKQEEEPSLDTGKSFEEKIDSILKLDPAEKSTPNNTISDVMNSSALSESSVILQETCSVGAAKSKVILDRIHGMVDVFCKNINETEGNISLNVSLNYKPPQNSSLVENVKTRDSLNVSLETSGAKDNIVEKSLNESKRSSMDKSKRISLTPKKSVREMDVGTENDQSEDVELTKHQDDSALKDENASKRSSMNKSKRISLTPKKSVKEMDMGTENEQSKNAELTKHQDDHALKDENAKIESEGSEKVKKRRRNRKKSKKNNDSPIETNAIPKEESSRRQKKGKPEPSSDILQDNKSEKIASSQTKPQKKMEKSEQKITHEYSDRKEEKKRKTKSISDSHEKHSSEEKSGKTRNKRDASPEQYQRKTTEKTKDKKGKRKNPESIENEVPSKKVCTTKSKLPDNIQARIEAKNLKEIKPTKSSKRQIDSEKMGSKRQKMEFKASNSNKESEWEEEVAVIQPSAANTSISGFNLEKIISRDFKNRMIYDSSRNKREPCVKSRRQHKK